MAGLGRKVFTAGDVLTASDVQNYLMDQTVMNFAGTAARSSAIATPTTGMTTYIGTTGTATIPQLEVYTGSAFQTPYGLTQVANVSFTTTTTVNIDNVFTSAYLNYQILVNVTGSSTGNHSFNLRAAGVTNSTSNYFYGAATIIYGSSSFNGSNGVSLTLLPEGGRADAGAPSATNYTVYNPQAVDRTYAQLVTTDSTLTRNVGMLFNATTQFDGFAYAAQSGTLTGNIRVYGLRNS